MPPLLIDQIRLRIIEIDSIIELSVESHEFFEWHEGINDLLEMAGRDITARFTAIRFKPDFNFGQGNEVVNMTFYKTGLAQAKTLINNFLRVPELYLSTSNDAQLIPQLKMYVKPQVIEMMKRYGGTLNMGKLIALAEELNDNYGRDNAYSCASLIRNIIDHIPPLFGMQRFSQVVENHAWGRTDRALISRLAAERIVADDVLHRQISDQVDLIDMNDIPAPTAINRLIQEAVSLPMHTMESPEQPTL